MKHFIFYSYADPVFFPQGSTLTSPPSPPKKSDSKIFATLKKEISVIFSKVKDGVGTSLLQSGTIRKSLIVSWISEGMQGVFLISFLCT